MRDPNKLMCPSCHSEVSSLKIGSCDIRCPVCDTVVLVWRQPAAPLSKGRLWATLDSEQVVFYKALRPWMHPDRMSATGILLGWMFEQIAAGLPE